MSTPVPVPKNEKSTNITGVFRLVGPRIVEVGLRLQALLVRPRSGILADIRLRLQRLDIGLRDGLLDVPHALRPGLGPRVVLLDDSRNIDLPPEPAEELLVVLRGAAELPGAPP